MSQAEHDESAQSILITDDAAFGARRGGGGRANGCRRWSAARSPGRAGATTARSSRSRDLDEAAALADRIAPEHLELCAADPEGAGGEDLPRRRDLPRIVDTGGDRRLRRRAEPRAAHGPLGAVLVRSRVLDFMKRTTVSKMTPAALRAIGPAAEMSGEVGEPRSARAVRPGAARQAERGVGRGPDAECAKGGRTRTGGQVPVFLKVSANFYFAHPSPTFRPRPYPWFRNASALSALKSPVGLPIRWPGSSRGPGA